MTRKMMPLKGMGFASTDRVAVLIERVADGFIYDPVDASFKHPSVLRTAPLLSLSFGPLGIHRRDLITEGWQDGRYTCTFVWNGVACDEEAFDLYGGEWRPLTTTEIAMRVLSARATQEAMVLLDKLASELRNDKGGESPA